MPLVSHVGITDQSRGINSQYIRYFSTRIMLMSISCLMWAAISSFSFVVSYRLASILFPKYSKAFEILTSLLSSMLVFGILLKISIFIWNYNFIFRLERFDSKLTIKGNFWVKMWWRNIIWRKWGTRFFA